MDTLDWTPVAEYKTANGLDGLTTKQWKAYRVEHALDIRNMGGVWYVSSGLDLTPEEPAPSMAAAPTVVSFGGFSHPLTVVNNSPAGDIAVTQHNYGGLTTGAVADEAGAFVSQLGSFTEFLRNTEAMLHKRADDLERNTQVKRAALDEAMLTVEVIKQRVLQERKTGIATAVENQALDTQMRQAVDLGKSLHTGLSSLQ